MRGLSNQTLMNHFFRNSDCMKSKNLLLLSKYSDESALSIKYCSIVGQTIKENYCEENPIESLAKTSDQSGTRSETNYSLTIHLAKEWKLTYEFLEMWVYKRMQRNRNREHSGTLLEENLHESKFTNCERVCKVKLYYFVLLALSNLALI